MRHWMDRSVRVIVALVAVFLLQSVASRWMAGGRSRRNSCQEHLTMIDGAKEQWALEHGRRIGDAPPTVRDLVAPLDGNGGYLRAFPVCPKGGRYTIGPIGSDPTCDSGLPGHSLSEVGDAILSVPPEPIPDPSGVVPSGIDPSPIMPEAAQH